VIVDPIKILFPCRLVQQSARIAQSEPERKFVAQSEHNSVQSSISFEIKMNLKKNACYTNFKGGAGARYLFFYFMNKVSIIT
jgi:hypothetical protein